MQNTKELSSALTNLEILEGDVLLLSDQYIQLGCDLRNISHLDKTLSNVIDIESSLILLTAEVSITYMQAEYSNELIRWASKLPDCESLSGGYEFGADEKPSAVLSSRTTTPRWN